MSCTNDFVLSHLNIVHICTCVCKLIAGAYITFLAQSNSMTLKTCSLLIAQNNLYAMVLLVKLKVRLHRHSLFFLSYTFLCLYVVCVMME